VNERLAAALADRYRIERELGQGGMATVYLAEDLKHHRKVAVKVLKPELAAILGAERFLAEIKVTANLQHPNLLPLFDSGTAGQRGSGVDEFLYYVMPYVEGETLRARLERERQLPVDETVRMITLLAGALDYAHAHGVIHRDLKPENILLQAGQPVIADFGIALAVAQAGGSRVTETGLSLGTPHYMSPEQAAGDRSLDAKSDQYALAAVTYEMLSGEPPHTGPTAQAIIARLMTEKPRSLRATRPAVPVAMDLAIGRALAKVPADRFPSCGAFAKALVVSMTSGAADVAGDPATRRRGLWVATAIALVVLAAGVLVIARYLGRTTTIDSIVVLPFENRSNDAEVEYISDGLTESISNSLTRLPGLKIIPTSIAFHYKGNAMNAQQVGDELGIAGVLTGRVAQRDDSLFVSVELVDVRRGSQLWGMQYNRKLADLLAVQRDIAGEVSQRLRSQRSGEVQERVRNGSTDNPEAYQLYLKGNYFTAKNTKDGYAKGVAFFKEALAIDSNYALAWDGLAFNYMAAEDWFVPPREAAPLAETAARRALAIDSTLASAHLSLGMVAHWYHWDWAAAEREFTRAIEMRPTDPRPHAFYAWLLATLGRFDQSITEAERGQQLDPVSVEASDYVGAMLTLAHRHDDAIVQLRTTIELDPTYFYAYDWLGRAYEQTGRMPEAITAYQKAVELEPVNAENWANLAHAYAASGRAAEARQIINDLKATSARSYVAPYNIALIYAGLGDKEQAFAWLERAYDDRSSLLVLYMVNDARWDRLHSDPRYADLLRRIGLPASTSVAETP
jgi:serine/threonine protein kinase/tetratricopeptide (TPR) repeat protein